MHALVRRGCPAPAAPTLHAHLRSLSRLPHGQRVPQSEASRALAIFDHRFPVAVGLRWLVLPLPWVVLPLNTGKRRHRIGRGGLDTIVGGARAPEEVVARPRDMVPGDQTVQGASRKIVAPLRIGDRVAQLRLLLVPRQPQRTDHERYAFNLDAGVFALAVRVEVDGLQVWKRGAVLGQESLQSHLQMRAKLTPERTGELPAAEAR